jgi:hypothetical protein
MDAEEYFVCCTAVETLAAILKAEAVPDLLKALLNPRICTPAAVALGELGADARVALPQLHDIAENGPPGPRKAAAEAMERILNATRAKSVR